MESLGQDLSIQPNLGSVSDVTLTQQKIGLTFLESQELWGLTPPGRYKNIFYSFYTRPYKSLKHLTRHGGCTKWYVGMIFF